MSRHVMVERDFADNPIEKRMTQAESGLVSEDVWWEMVDRLLDERHLDQFHHQGAVDIELSRGRHHVPESYLLWTELPDGALFIYASKIRPDGAVYRRVRTSQQDGYQMIWDGTKQHHAPDVIGRAG